MSAASSPNTLLALLSNMHTRDSSLKKGLWGKIRFRCHVSGQTDQYVWRPLISGTKGGHLTQIGLHLSFLPGTVLLLLSTMIQHDHFCLQCSTYTRNSLISCECLLNTESTCSGGKNKTKYIQNTYTSK